jgi:hypothetical protein
LLLAAGGLAAGYLAWWVWKYRGAVVNGPDFAAWAAVSMPCMWVLFSAVVLVGNIGSFRRTVSFLVFIPTFALVGGFMMIELEPPLWLFGIVLGLVIGCLFVAAVGEGNSSTQTDRIIETILREAPTRRSPGDQ